MKISRDFTFKVAEQMPDTDYGFKLTPPRLSFAEQMVHLVQGSITPRPTGLRPRCICEAKASHPPSISFELERLAKAV
jgi:hypothetical protein